MTQPWDPDLYTAAWTFAAGAHAGQKYPGTEYPYILHVGNVAMEVASALARESGVESPDLAVQCALLHDVLEDTNTGFEQLAEAFGGEVAEGVRALSKDPTLATKDEQMADSLARIQAQPREVWMVKLADRISNLQEPPSHWDTARRARYKAEAGTILDALGAASDVLAERLRRKIALYGAWRQ